MSLFGVISVMNTFFIVIAIGVLCRYFQTSYRMQPEEKILSPCFEDDDPFYYGIRVNCQHNEISSLPLPEHWIPMGVTTLLLDYNSITYLTNNSFPPSEKWSSVRYIGLSNNNISLIDDHVFSRFSMLQKLNLSHNIIDLDESSLSGQAFQNLYSLKELDLSFNKNEYRTGRYHDFLFSNLLNLTTLRLDTFNGKLVFGSLLNNSCLLSSLTLTGGLTTIKSNSFENFTSIRLETLIVTEGFNFWTTEPGAFRFLPYLKWFELSNVIQSVEKTLDSLEAFFGRNMSGLIFKNLGYAFVSDYDINFIGLCLPKSPICVENFALRGSNLLDKQFERILGWLEITNCLKSLDLSENPVGERLIIIIGKLLYDSSSLEYFIFSGGKYGRMSSSVKIWQPPICINAAINSRTRNEISMMVKDEIQSWNNMQYRGCVETEIVQDDLETLKSELRSLQSTARQRNTLATFDYDCVRSFYLPERLRVLVLNGVFTKSFRIDEHLAFKRKSSTLRELHLSDNGIRQFLVSPSGIKSIQLLDISKNNGSNMATTFFESTPNLIHLNMAQMNLDIHFMAMSSNVLFQNSSELVTLDLSNNELYLLSENTFTFNSNLHVIILAGNRFLALPFDLSLTPNLCWLDMRKNSIIQLSQSDIESVDRHAERRGQFSLSLNGNRFHCGCENIRFLSWLQRTTIDLDNDGDYPCISDDGRLMTTGRITDFSAMWRICYGKNGFWISVILFCQTLLGFIIGVIIFKFKSHIEDHLSVDARTLFITKTSMDYPIGVFIGHANKNKDLVTQKLLPLIEGTCSLSTFLPKRDKTPGSSLAESVVEAIYHSWRILLVVSEEFLADPDSELIMTASIFAAQVGNPRRIVLLVVARNNHESLLSRLPNSVLQEVNKEAIIHVTPNMVTFSLKETKALVSALMSP